MAYTAIDNPTDFFRAKLYNGNNNPQNIAWDETDTNMAPDWLWIKSRAGNSVFSHVLGDSVRGGGKYLVSDTNAAEVANNNVIASFNTNGFSVGGATFVSEGSRTYVAWGWKANGSGSENTVGDLTVTALSVNQTAGISIGRITDGFTSTGTNSETVGHGLGAIPQVIIVKNREATGDWQIYHAELGNTKKIKLNSTDGSADSTLFNNTTPTSSVWSVRGGDFATGEDIVFYAFAQKQGYSKFGSYTGNNNADGTFVYTGFKPAWIIIKRDTNNYNWYMFDSKRDPTNIGAKKDLDANNASAEVADRSFDFLSNGIKFRDTNAGTNAAQKYIYMAFAENPFVTSTGIPATAK